MTAAAGELPGFTLAAPVLPLSSHDLPSLKANQLRLKRSSPLELTWASTSGEALLLMLQFPWTNSLARQRFVACTWPASSGAATVPTAVMGHLKPSSAGLNTNIYFGATDSKTLSLEGLELRSFAFKNEVARVQVDD